MYRIYISRIYMHNIGYTPRVKGPINQEYTCMGWLRVVGSIKL